MITMVWLLLGLVTGWGFVVYACRYPEKSRPTIWAQGLVVAGFVYIIFAVVGGHYDWLKYELIGLSVCILFALLGTKHSPYWLAMGWGLHPVWDIYVHLIGPASDVAPSWYAVLCLSFDVFVASHIVRAQVVTKIKTKRVSRTEGNIE